MTDEQNEHEGVDYCAYLVAFFDILGQRDKMSRISNPPLQEDSETVDKYKQAVFQLYMNVKSFRSFFTAALKIFMQSGVEKSDMPEQVRSFLRKLQEQPIIYRTFADSVVVHVRLMDDEMQYGGRAIYGVLGAAAGAFNSCMANGIPIRGGIDIGFAMNIGPDEIYGPALASAYHLESKVANYPRIVVGNKLVAYLRALADSSSATFEEKGYQLLANKSLALMTKDHDDNMIVDHLGEYIRNILQKIPEMSSAVSGAYTNVSAEYEKYKLALHDAERGDDIKALDRQKKLVDKYELIKRYYEKRLPLWGIK